MQLIAQSKTKTRSKPCQSLPTLVETGAAQRRGEGHPKGEKTYRMLQRSFGSKPWSRAGAAAVAWSAAVAAAGSAAADEGNEARTDSTAALYGEKNPKP